MVESTVQTFLCSGDTIGHILERCMQFGFVSGSAHYVPLYVRYGIDTFLVTKL